MMRQRTHRFVFYVVVSTILLVLASFPAGADDNDACSQNGGAVVAAAGNSLACSVTTNCFGGVCSALVRVRVDGIGLVGARATIDNPSLGGPRTARCGPTLGTCETAVSHVVVSPGQAIADCATEKTLALNVTLTCTIELVHVI